MNATLYFDGSCREVIKNGEIDKKIKVISGGWIVIFNPDPFVATGFAEELKGNYTSTTAEWLSLHSGLKWLSSISGVSKIIIRGDSECVINSIKKNTTPRNKADASFSYSNKCKKILSEMNIPYIIQWIGRRNNWAADRLSRKVSLNIKLVKEIELTRKSEKLIGVVAESLWVKAGYPVGRDVEFWLEAEKMLIE